MTHTKLFIMKKILSFLLISGASYSSFSQCTTIVAPWMEGFEGMTTTNYGTNNNCWSANGSGPYWRTNSGYTTSSNTGPSSAHGGTRYSYLETSTGAGTDSLKTPNIDISGLANPALTFHYHMYGATIGTLAIDVYDGTSWSPVLWSLTGAQQTDELDPWIQAVVSLTSIPGNVVKVRFTANRNGSFNGDIAIDDVGIIDCTPTTSTISATSCGYYTAPSGKLLHDAGTYVDTIANSVGCDSLITINLTTTNTFNTLTISNICGTYTMPSGLVVGDNGVYTDTTTNSVGCDSVINYSLSFDNSYNSFSTSACNSYTAPSGTVYTLSGVYSDTIVNSLGCDSIMTITLEMFFDNSLTVFATTCGGSFTSDAGNVYTITGLYQENYNSVNGCDSIVYIDLTVAEGNNQDIDINACDEWTSDAGMTYTSSGTYQEVFMGSTGCDSVINYDVVINTISSVATLVSAMTVEASEAGATYQWVDCNNSNTPVPGAQSKIFIASVNGDYACLVTKNGCTEMTNCVRVGSLGVDNNDNAFSIYPNPSNGVFAIEMPNVIANTTVTITNAAGQIVYSSSINNSTSTIDVSNVEAGMYFVSIINETGTAKKAIIIE